MTEKEITDKIVTLIAEELGVDEVEVTRNADLVVDLGADSLDVAEITFALEEMFEIEIDDEEYEGFDNVGEVIDLVLGRVGK